MRIKVILFIILKALGMRQNKFYIKTRIRVSQLAKIRTLFFIVGDHWIKKRGYSTA